MTTRATFLRAHRLRRESRAERYRAGKSMAQIAAEDHVTPEAVRLSLIRCGVESRRKGPRGNSPDYVHCTSPPQ